MEVAVSVIEEPGFQRARSHEQRELRRRAILDAAEVLLAEVPLEDLGLRELSRRLGTSKTNVVRYFESREGVLLALLNRTRQLWLDDLEKELPAAPADLDGVIRVWADTLAARPLLCQLWSLLAMVLERNVSAESVRAYKLEDLEQRTRLAGLLSERVRGLDARSALHLTRIGVVILAGLWPFANPTPAIVEATADPRLVDARVDFPQVYADMLGLAAQGLLGRP
ncbi:MAG: TetR-family transcriptional regulator [Amycolatopsis sp.]|uniref:TetR/AcrR family transcriptional regulator n=1 Tax=Amycolatopsis sp. TaxID=37632 RepID=UPI00260AC44D|nr:TetR family transcriptional regulator [Amycolatopsis sp.]MCU1681519.1 TetR-family transcriptional regulator [Amycolatopsis sp.]